MTVEELAARLSIEELYEWGAFIQLKAEQRDKAIKEAEQKAKRESRARPPMRARRSFRGGRRR